MKDYLVKKINLTKYIFLFSISFTLIFALTFLLNKYLKADPNLLLIINSIIFIFLVLPNIKKKNSVDLTIKISSQEIYSSDFQIDIRKIDYIETKYKFTKFPKITIGLNNGEKYIFRVINNEYDYQGLINELNTINNSKQIHK